MSAPLTGPAWYWFTGTVALVLMGWALCMVIGGAALGLWARAHPRATTGQAAEDQAPTEPPAPAEPPQRAPAQSFRYVLGTKTCGCAYKSEASTGGQWVLLDICDHHLMAVAREWGLPS